MIQKNKVAAVMRLLRTYAEENGTIVRGTSDLSPLELWLINQLASEHVLTFRTEITACNHIWRSIGHQGNGHQECTLCNSMKSF